MKAQWSTRPLGELCDILDSKRKPITKRDRTPGDIPYYGATGIQDYVAGYLFDEPLVLVGEDGAKWGPGENTAFAVEGKCWVNNHAHVLRPHRAFLLDAWLIHYLNHLDLSEFVSGLTVPKLNQGRLCEIPIPVPPLPEQHRIVSVLDKAFDGIANAKANTERSLQNARELLESAFAALTTNAEQAQWLKTTVAALAAPKRGAIRTGPFGSQLLHSEFVEQGIAVLGIDNAVANEFLWGKSRFITPEKYRQLERYRVYPGDVLITIMGTCGRCAVVPDDIPVAINTKHLCCITLDHSKCLPAYLHAYFLYHPVAREFLLAQADGAIMDGLNMGIIERLPVHLPSITRQAKFISDLESFRQDIRRLDTLYRQKLEALDELKKSLLHQAFSGGM
ncbi:restriction endonuclease subunit S [Myxococcus sp. CA051A]|uniref:restriction endonuclease subunit S n=1 Tax=Myxococcus sp. CA051A TaxID=2741739 RepID=UPI00157B958B|nr:restriction endonuclease subunit S [Myxococcus sp. CA051A]